MHSSTGQNWQLSCRIPTSCVAAERLATICSGWDGCGNPDPLRPAHPEELANIADETGAEVLRGSLRYPSYSGGSQLGDMDFSEHLAKCREHEVVVIIASLGRARNPFDAKKITPL